jgi:GDPmannose 4,6-dehydratase
MIAIIFGINGQDGYYLDLLCKNKGIQVIGVSRNNAKWLVGDVGNYSFVEQLIKENKPDYIFHLAANSTTRHDALWENHEAIERGTLNILESAKLHSPASKVFLSGSAVQFENHGLPIDEGTCFAPLSPYAVSRIQSVYAGRYYRNVFGIKVYVGYFFNHDSPLRTERHINKKITEAVIRIANGSNEKIEIGDVTVKKEFNFAADVVDAIWTLVNQDAVFEAVIGSGLAYSIEDWLEICFGQIDEHWQDHVIIKNNFIPEYKTLTCNPAIIYSLGWKPSVNIEELAKLMLKTEK